MTTRYSAEQTRFGGFFCLLYFLHMKRLFGLITLTVLVVGLHLAATRLYLYYTTWWADVILHFIGGAWLAVMASTFMQAFNKELSLKGALIFTLIFGIGWEAFEYFFDLIAFSTLAECFDSLSDLCLDLFGGCMAYYLFGLPRREEGEEETEDAEELSLHA
jgi:hypothetical protein